jgi:hypothetical protein
MLRRIGIVLSACLFTGGLFLAIQATPDLLQKVALAPFLMLFAVSVAFQPALNAAEFRVMVEFGGQRVGWLTALEVTVYTTASNLLPLPGGVLTRMAAMRGYGIPTRKAGLIIILGLAVWGGAASAYSGAWLVFAGEAALGSCFLLLGALALWLAVALCRRLHPSWALLARILTVRLAALVVEAARLTLAIYALGDQISFDQASVLVVSSFVGAIVAVAPAGLGVREAAVAALSSFVGLDPSIGFLAASVNRIAGLLGLILIAASVFAILKRGKAAGAR